MNHECQHCGKLRPGKTYRVISEDSGTTLLDLTVCYDCFLEARRLGLHAEEVKPRELFGGYHAHA
jgi:ribosome-binding protein aMBF1 (putative translation factor)